jgi:hypothetical protein
MHAIVLKVCNEAGRCKSSNAHHSRPYGPITQSALISVWSQQSGKKMRWRVHFNANGRPVNIRIKRYRNGELLSTNVRQPSTYTTDALWSGWINVGSYGSYTGVDVTVTDRNSGRKGTAHVRKSKKVTK